MREKEDKIIEITDSIEQYGPMSDLKVVDLKDEGNPQIYTINSSGQ